MMNDHLDVDASFAEATRKEPKMGLDATNVRFVIFADLKDTHSGFKRPRATRGTQRHRRRRGRRLRARSSTSLSTAPRIPLSMSVVTLT